MAFFLERTLYTTQWLHRDANVEQCARVRFSAKVETSLVGPAIRLNVTIAEVERRRTLLLLKSFQIGAPKNLQVGSVFCPYGPKPNFGNLRFTLHRYRARLTAATVR